MIATTYASIRISPATRHKAARFVVSAFGDALLIWLVLGGLAYHTVGHLPAGETYIFAPRGVGLVIDSAIHIGLFTGFFVLYTLPAFMVRRWLGWVLRILMFGIFVVFLTYMGLTKIIAIVETPDHKTIFYPHFPLAPRVFDRAPNAEMRRNNVVVSLSFLTGKPEDLMVYPVYRQDASGQADIERLRRHINIVKVVEE
jgi:hypothetical protein